MASITVTYHEICTVARESADAVVAFGIRHPLHRDYVVGTWQTRAEAQTEADRQTAASDYGTWTVAGVSQKWIDTHS